MIIFRYLSREVLQSTLAVTAVLMLIITSARLIKYLADAAAGKLEAGAVFLVLLYRMPGFLELLLPLGLFLGILLAYGRLYLDSEMVVLSATGVSQKRLLLYTLGPASVVAVCVAVLSLYLSPYGLSQAERVFAQQESRSELDLLTPGRFQSQSSGQVTYAEALVDDRLKQVFISQLDNQGRPILLIAESAERRLLPEQNQRFLVLHQGYRFDGRPGDLNFTRIAYQEYGVQLPEPELSAEIRALDAQSSAALWQATGARERAALHWRFSLPVLALVVALLAVPLSHTNPRQGRFARLIPAILAYLLYVGLLTSVRSELEKGAHPAVLWAIHLAFLLIAANLIWLSRFWSKLVSRGVARLMTWLPKKRAV
ncbi:LPS export ABC transporter permease LptF [Nitrincola tapanii]|uniref:Lipopolysaccharide export system permease protein LptF n=1 Tax=Nitrincola tapanii TaxID=1708751 RepID=A0A5A9W2J7_9GAMM|nr:LPS export ABC transporter permease LptF [Nitrincola tapanii]KAA0874724.1 LPS export ABC transporter permease LptF [Nitrincola tapanii]